MMQKLKSLLSRYNTPFKLLAYLAKRILPSPLQKPIRWLVRSIIAPLEEHKIARHRQLLESLRSTQDPARPVIIIAPSLDWYTQLFQRPQQLAMAFARQGAYVYYIQPLPDRNLPPFQQINERLFLCSVNARALDKLAPAWVYVLTWNAAYRAVFPKARTIYDYVDEIDVFYGDTEAFAKYHSHLLQEAGLVVTTAQNLYQEALASRTDAILCPNAVEYDHFAQKSAEEKEAVPEDLRPIVARGKPLIGYYGALARWFDYDLFSMVANLRPDYQFVLIGPDYDGTLLREKMLDCHNLTWLGVKKYAELPAYLHRFDTAMIPFVVNQITHSTSPLKLFEYMAGGKPVVITPMRESMRYPGVLVGATPQEFAEKLDEALRLKSSSEYLSLIDRVARENTWDARARQILDAIQPLGSSTAEGSKR